MSVVNAVNSIMFGFEGILKSWLAGLQEEEPLIFDKWSKTVMIDFKGQPILLSDGTQESNYIGALLDAIREEFVGPIEDNEKLQVMQLQRQKLKRIEFFHPYYFMWLRRLFQLKKHRDGSWQPMFVASLPAWFVNKLQPSLQALPFKPSWGALYQNVIACIIKICDEHSTVKRIIKHKDDHRDVSLLFR